MPTEFRPFDQFRWTYSEAPSNHRVFLLLCVDGRKVVEGRWSGRYGDSYIAWAPAPARDKVREKELIAQGKIRR